MHASYFRTLAVACLPHLRTLNGLNVSAEERLLAEHTWRRLKRLYTLASACQHAPYTPPPYQHAMHLHERQPAGAGSKPAAPGAHESAEVAGSFVKRVLVRTPAPPAPPRLTRPRAARLRRRATRT